MEKFHLLLTDQVDLMNPKGNRVVHDMSKPLPLGGPPGQVIIHTQYFFNKDLEYLVSGNKKRRHALLISKLKATYYPDFGVKELVPSLWTKSESAYDISLAYGISHCGSSVRNSTLQDTVPLLDRKQSDQHEDSTDYKEYKISKADFKNLHPNDFEDMYLLHFQGKLNHLSRADKVYLSTAINLWTRNIVIRQRVEYLQLDIESYQTKLYYSTDINDQKKMMRETEVHKFSDGTLTRIMEKLDYMVKDYVGLEVGSITAYPRGWILHLEFLGVGTSLFLYTSNISHTLSEYGVLVFSGYDVLSLFSLWSLVKCRHGYAFPSLMDTAV
ncbi:hypothetical protein Tco_0059572 [Tanacetum coccineum]